MPDGDSGAEGGEEPVSADQVRESEAEQGQRDEPEALVGGVHPALQPGLHEDPSTGQSGCRSDERAQEHLLDREDRPVVRHRGMGIHAGEAQQDEQDG